LQGKNVGKFSRKSSGPPLGFGQDKCIRASASRKTIRAAYGPSRISPAGFPSARRTDGWPRLNGGVRTTVPHRRRRLFPAYHNRVHPRISC
jgi:hypothetical protein